MCDWHRRREELDAIIRGPFERFPGHFPAELPPELADCMIAEIVARNGSQAVNLSELQIACLTLWQSSDPIALFRTRGLEGLLEDYLSEAFSQFRKELRDPCLVLLSRMITPSGTRNVIARHDLVREGAESTISCEPWTGPRSARGGREAHSTRASA